ncbi:outer membrane beta-barrel protein [Haliscomenobacter sp.]|uniref:outer membrane beta-barrel protein n=1 Tax=Haliscomenobacter sp. TaxID=2717303 RepID=UPI003BABB31C
MKSIVTLFLIVSIALPIIAQNLQVGVSSGINFPDLHSDVDGLGKRQKEDKKRTLLFGIGMYYRINPNISLHSAVLYEERGWREKNVYTISEDFVYPFITTPVLIEFNLGKTIEIFANTGINNSLRIGGKSKTGNGAPPVHFIFPEDKKPLFDFGWVGGAGLRLSTKGKLTFQMEYRYYRSWTTIGIKPLDSAIKHQGCIGSLAAYYKISK